MSFNIFFLNIEVEKSEEKLVLLDYDSKQDSKWVYDMHFDCYGYVFTSQKFRQTWLTQFLIHYRKTSNNRCMPVLFARAGEWHFPSTNANRPRSRVQCASSISLVFLCKQMSTFFLFLVRTFFERRYCNVYETSSSVTTKLILLEFFFHMKDFTRVVTSSKLPVLFRCMDKPS